MRRKRRRRQGSKEGRQAVSNSLQDDLFTPVAWQRGGNWSSGCGWWVSGECHGRGINCEVTAQHWLNIGDRGRDGGGQNIGNGPLHVLHSSLGLWDISKKKPYLYILTTFITTNLECVCVYGESGGRVLYHLTLAVLDVECIHDRSYNIEAAQDQIRNNTALNNTLKYWIDKMWVQRKIIYFNSSLKQL